ncbi:hypothetical protein JCM1840_005362 [Sporobolomyces johnsonii]
MASEIASSGSEELQVDHLSLLPPELLAPIFAIARRDNRDKALLTAPLSKHLVPFQLQAGYRDIHLANYNQLHKLSDTVLANPPLGSMIRRLWFILELRQEGGQRGRWSEQEAPAWLTDDRLAATFQRLDHLEGLRAVASSGVASFVLRSSSLLCFPRTLTQLSLHSSFNGWDTHSLTYPSSTFTLPSQITHFILQFLPCSSSYTPESNVSSLNQPVPSSALPALEYLELVGPICTIRSFSQLVSSCSRLTTLNLRSTSLHSDFTALLQALPTPQSVTTLRIASSFLRPTRGPPSVDVGPLLVRFTNLQRLNLSGGCSTYGPDFFASLHTLPIRGLYLGPNEPVRAQSLLSLIAGPSKHPSLNVLFLNHVRSGKIGTRVGPHELDMPADWDVPSFPPNLSQRNVVGLYMAGRANGVQVWGSAVKAAAVLQAWKEDEKRLEENARNYTFDMGRVRQSLYDE